MESTSAPSMESITTEVAPSRCPIDRTAASGGVCPFPHAAGAAAPVHRTKADVVARRVLRISDRPPDISQAQAYSAFQKSMAISALRCTLTYVIFPFVLPAVGFATGVGPLLGITIGVIAITCDVFAVRRFFAVDHRWRWHFSAIAAGVIGLLAVLLVQDFVHLAT